MLSTRTSLTVEEARERVDSYRWPLTVPRRAVIFSGGSFDIGYALATPIRAEIAEACSLYRRTGTLPDLSSRPRGSRVRDYLLYAIARESVRPDPPH